MQQPQNRKDQLAKGLELWGKTAKRSQYTQETLKKLCALSPYKNTNDLFVALGSGHISVHALIKKMKEEDNKLPIQDNITLNKKQTTSTQKVNIGKFDNLLTQRARCCRPIPGDPIMGYVTKGQGVSIHRQTCKNIERSQAQHPERIIDISWNAEQDSTFPVEMTIIANQDPKLISAISSAISYHGLNLSEIHSHHHFDTHQTHFYVTLTVKSVTQCEEIIQAFNHLPGVNKVYRR